MTDNKAEATTRYHSQPLHTKPLPLRSTGTSKLRDDRPLYAFSLPMSSPMNPTCSLSRSILAYPWDTYVIVSRIIVHQARELPHVNITLTNTSIGFGHNSYSDHRALQGRVSVIRGRCDLPD